MLNPLTNCADTLVALNILENKTEKSFSTLFVNEYSPIWSKEDFFDPISGDDNAYFSPEVSNNGRLVRKVRSSHNQISQALYDVNNDPHLLISPDKYCMPCSQASLLPDDTASCNKDNEASIEDELHQGKLYQPFQVKINPEVSLLCDFHAHLSTAEVIGFLAGYWDADNRILYVQSSFPCTAINREDNGATDVELDPASELLVRETVASLGLVIVGWYHSHPRFKPDPSITDITNQQQYQHLLHDLNTGIDPFVGLIISTFDQRLPDTKSLHQWFHVIPHYLEKLKNLNLRGGACCPIYIPMQLQATIRERKKIKVNEYSHQPDDYDMKAINNYCSYKHNDKILYKQIEESLRYYSDQKNIDTTTDNDLHMDSYSSKQPIIIDLIDQPTNTNTAMANYLNDNSIAITTININVDNENVDDVTNNCISETNAGMSSSTSFASTVNSNITISPQPLQLPSSLSNTNTTIISPILIDKEDNILTKRKAKQPKHFSDYSTDDITRITAVKKVNNNNNNNNNNNDRNKSSNNAKKHTIKNENVSIKKQEKMSQVAVLATTTTSAAVSSSTPTPTTTTTRSGRVPVKKQYSDCVDPSEAFKKKSTTATANNKTDTTANTKTNIALQISPTPTSKVKHKSNPILTEIPKKKTKINHEDNELVININNINIDKTNNIINITDTPSSTPPYNNLINSEMTLNEYLGGGSSSPASIASRRLLCEILPIFRPIVIGVIGLSFFYKSFYRKVDLNAKWKGKTKKDKLFDCLTIYAKKLGIPNDDDIPLFVSELTEIVSLFWNLEKK